MADVNLFVAFAAGGLSFLSPCVLPLIPSYLSFVSGISPREMSEGASGSARVMGNAVAFVGGFSLAFVALGASASLLGRLLLNYQDVLRIGGGLFILVVGIYLTGLFKVATLERYAQFNLRSKPAGYLGSVLVGLTFAVAWIPCVGPILGAILTLAGTSTEIHRGVLLLSAYAAGLALPFLLSALAMNQFFRFSRAISSWLPAIHVCAGLLLVAVGLLLVTDNMTAVNALALRYTPEWLVTRL